MLRRLGAGAGHRGNSWYWRPRLSPQKLKILDTPEKAPGAREEWGQEESQAPASPYPSPILPIPHTHSLPPPPQGPGLPDKGLQVSLFSPSSVKGSPPGGSPGGLGLEKGTRRRGLELRPGPSSSLLSGLEGPLDGLSPHGPPGCPRQLGPGPTRAGPCPRADTSPGCSVSVGNREHTSERGENRGRARGAEQGAECEDGQSCFISRPATPRGGGALLTPDLWLSVALCLFLCSCAPSCHLPPLFKGSRPARQHSGIIKTKSPAFVQWKGGMGVGCTGGLRA